MINYKISDFPGSGKVFTDAERGIPGQPAVLPASRC